MANTGLARTKTRVRSPNERKRGFLPPFEWSFHLVPPDERHACLFYECCRERLRNEPGDEYCWLPWLRLSTAERKRHAKSDCGRSIPRSVRETTHFTHLLHMLPYSVTEEWLTKGIYPGQAKTLAVFEIDWSASDRKLRNDFAQFLAEQRGTRRSLALKYKGEKSKPGPKKDVNAELVDLAIFRAQNAGYPAKAINKNLLPLLHGLDHYFKNGKLNSQGVYDAWKRVRSRMRRWPA